MTEQQPHGEQTPDEQPANSPAPGGELEPSAGTQPVEESYSEQPHAEVPPADAEQLRQFQRFQEFQQFQRFQEQQRQAGYDPAQLPPPPPNGQQRPYPKIKAPRWLQWLGKKVLGWLIFAALTALALTWAYNHFLDDEDVDKPAAETGGGTVYTNPLLATNPYETVRNVYDAIARGEPVGKRGLVHQACGRFNQEARADFASNLGFPDCPTAVHKIHDEVMDATDYASSIRGSAPNAPVTRQTVTINSCDFDINGGPSLGIFTVKKLVKSENKGWLIIGHRAGPEECPDPPPSTGPTR